MKKLQFPGVLTLILSLGFVTDSAVFAAQQDAEKHPLAGIPLRPIGPAITSGRISDFAFHPENRNEFYVGVASGGLWKTDNNTITWQPLFDSEASYAIGVVELAPSDPQNCLGGNR